MSGADDRLERAHAALRSGDPAAARDLFDAVAAERPGDPGALLGAGLARLRLGDFDAARDRFLAVLDSRDDPMAHNCLGEVARLLDRDREALPHYRRALEIAPDFADAHNNIGIVLRRLGRDRVAARHLERALALVPAHAPAHANLGLLLSEQGRMRDAQRHYALALESDPTLAEMEWARASGLLPMLYESDDEVNETRARYAEALERLASAACKPGGARALLPSLGEHGPFYLAYQGRDDRLLQSRFGAIARSVGLSYPGPLPDPPARTGRDRIRVAVVSGHIRRHSVWDVIASGFVQELDRTRFEVFGYHTRGVRDRETALAERRFDRFHQGPHGLSDWVARFREDRPDAVFYPEIGMDEMVVKLASLRLAPLQVASWGHPTTSGLPSIDAFVSGDLLEPEGAERHYTEELVRLPGLGCNFTGLDVAPEPVDLASLGLAPGRDVVRFVCCQQVFKYHPAHDEVFARIARALPGPCEFVFFRYERMAALSEQLERRLRAVFAAHGLDADRHCRFIAPLPRPEFLGLLGQMDVYLDTPGFSGFTTAAQAVCCDGLPLVTLEGDLMRSRLAAAVLRRIGVTSTIARSVDDYVDIAVRLGSDPAHRREVRDRARAGLAALHDNVEAVRAFEDFLEERVSRSPPAFAPREPWRGIDADDGYGDGVLEPDYLPLALVDMADSPPAAALDVGCFAGATGAFLKARFRDCRVVGVEPGRSAAARARRRLDAVVERTLEDFEPEAADLAPGEVDLVVLADVLEHMPNPWAQLERIRDWLSPRGELLVSLPNVRHFTLIARLARGEFRYEAAGLMDVTHLRFFTRAQILEMFEQTGYRVVDLRRNLDPSLGTLLDQPLKAAGNTIATDGIFLDGLSDADVLDLATLQFFLRVRPDRG